MLESWFSSSGSALTAVERSPEEQRQVDLQTAELALYHYDSCMFCARVRKAIAGLNLKIELRDVLRDAGHRRELEQGGGRSTVPCLRIGLGKDGKWMYESADIIAYLAKRFGKEQGAATS
ncbi:MAG: glutaredoxin [Proteobacteria bacterium]|nr:glutaredoxin [Pseudomonadota bacterium]